MAKLKRRRVSLDQLNFDMEEPPLMEGEPMDVYEEDPRKVILEKRKKAQRNLYIKIFIVFAVIGLIVAFFVSDLSKVHEITITGNKLVLTSDIKKAITVTKDDVFLFTSSSTIKNDVEKVKLIKSATVKKGLMGDFHVEVSEEEIIAFTTFKKKTYLIGEKGDVVELKKGMDAQDFSSLPQLSKFKSLDMIKSFAKEYVKVPDLIQNSISDVVYAPKSADQTRVRLILTSGKELIVRIEAMADNLSEKNFNFEGYMSRYKDYRYFSFEGRFIRVSN